MMNQDMNEKIKRNDDIGINSASDPIIEEKGPRKTGLTKLRRLTTFLLVGALILGTGFCAGYGTATLVISSGKDKYIPVNFS